MDTEKVFVTAIAVFFGPMVLLLLYFLFVMAPVAFWTEAKCLRNGYPKSTVTIGLETYCMNLDGSVTVKVDKASKGAK